MSKKPIGYSKKDRDEMKTLIERTEPKSGDYVGSGTVTQVPKKKKMKRMQMGGMAMPTRGTMPNERGAMPVRGGGGVPLQGPGGVMVRPPRNETKLRPVSPGPILDGGKGSEYPGMPKIMADRMVRPPRSETNPRSDRPSIKGKSMRDLRVGVGPLSLMDRVKAARGMKGGGLARKGVGMALAKGGLVNANGCAARGKTKGKMV